MSKKILMEAINLPESKVVKLYFYRS